MFQTHWVSIAHRKIPTGSGKDLTPRCTVERKVLSRLGKWMVSCMLAVGVAVCVGLAVGCWRLRLALRLAFVLACWRWLLAVWRFAFGVWRLGCWRLAVGGDSRSRSASQKLSQSNRSTGLSQAVDEFHQGA